jgi:flagellar basal-body rod protein FlgC
MAAEQLRLRVIAENIRNAQATSPTGPYTRRAVVFREVLGDEPNGPKLAGVSAAEIVEDRSAPYKILHQPGHPHADAQGNVTYPNVDIITEMVDMIAASEAYAAHTQVFASGRQMTQRALELLRT